MVPEIGVVGGNGFLGKNLTRYFQAASITKENAESACKQHYNVLINASGNSNKRLADKEPILDFDLSVRSVLETVTKYSFGTYVYISSCEVYGGEDTREDSVLDVSKMSRYGLSKYLAECVVRQYCSRWLILRLNGPIGPHMRKGPVYDILKGDRLWLNADSRFQFLHTNLISEFIRFGLLERNCNSIYNLTGPDAVSLYDAMGVLRREVVSSNDPPVIHRIDTSKANKILGMPSSMESLRRVRRDYEA
jgi:nucleoside-diphosphate-sugar epimerase